MWPSSHESPGRALVVEHRTGVRKARNTDEYDYRPKLIGQHKVILMSRSSVAYAKFSSSLTIYEVKTKEIITMAVVWIPDLN